MKRLFFSALVAIVAVGGAYAQQYSTQPNGAGTKFNCTGAVEPLCSTSFPSGAYIYPTANFQSELPDLTTRIVQ